MICTGQHFHMYNLLWADSGIMWVQDALPKTSPVLKASFSQPSNQKPTGFL